jgi:hypothetical protein
MDGMQSTTLERPDVRPDDGHTGDGADMFHYVKKDQMVNSAVEGAHVVALCGETFPVTRTSRTGAPVCPDCKRIFDQLPK